MKIIDEKGKLFGLINIIDLTVLLVVALLVVGGARRMKTKPIIVNETTTARITYEVAEVRMPTVENLLVGDELEHYDRGGHIGEVVEVSYEPYTEPIEGDNEWIEAEVPGKYNLLFVVEAEVNDSPDVLVVGGEQTRVGTQYRMKNKRVAFFGTCLDVDIFD